MQRISITNPQNIIDGTAKKYYFKLRNTGGPKGDKGDKGDTGQTGPQGPKGDAATVAVGSTTTLAVGQDATVENVGSIYNAVLNFGIPQGPQGPKGDKGNKGDTGAQGETGPRGPQGERGTNATVYIGTTSTLNPGSQATVYNSGTDSNAVLNFGIPKGEKGDTGPMPTIAQTTGQAIDQVMSQKATTDALNTKQATIDSSHKLSADLVDDTSTTNKFVTAQDKTNWNAKQDALTAGDNIDIEDGVISTPAIAPEVVAELPTTGNEGKLYLTPKNYTRGTGTGNPIEATITDEAGQMESFKLDGDTFQQTYTGKNLFNKNDTGILDDVRVSTSNGKTYGAVGNHVSYFIKVEPSTTYVLTTGRTAYYAWYSAPSEDSYISGSGWGDEYYFASPANAQYIRFDFADGNIVQFVKGTSVGDYEPYVGGQPSPNPEYPQQIQTVTGEQTVSINGTNYPLDLGTIELCDIGGYQDYIHKVGEDWKIHKSIGHEKRLVNIAGIDSNASVYGSATTSNGAFAITNNNWGSDYTTTAGIALASTVVGRYQSQNIDSNVSANSMADGTFCQRSGTNDRVYFRFASWARSKTVGEVQQMLTDNGGVDLWYPLATTTDTTITDTDLIAQLEAIRTASLENGTNTITNTATGSNLAGDMEVGFYGYDPRNRYDKWLWLDLNNEYEQIGS